jgi:hypothetical protein
MVIVLKLTRRALLSRAAHIGLASVGLQIIGVGCDLLPGRSAHLPRIGYFSGTAPARDTNDPYFQAFGPPRT